MFKSKFSGYNEIWSAQNHLGGHCPGMPPLATGLPWVKN